MKLKIQHVRVCQQCRDVLPVKCEKCVKHPERKPRVVEIFDAPEILETLKCGCVGFKCQRPDCPKMVYRKLKRDGTLELHNHFCSRSCNSFMTASSKPSNAVSLPCSNGCGTVVKRPPSKVKLARFIYCGRGCKYEHRIKINHERRELIKRAIESGAVQNLECWGKCPKGSITKHTKDGRDYVCPKCGERRSVEAMPRVDGMDAANQVRRERELLERGIRLPMAAH